MAINGTTIAQVPRPESQAATHHPSGLVPCPYCTSVFPGVLSFLPQPVSWIQSLFYFTSNLIQASLVCQLEPCYSVWSGVQHHLHSLGPR
jgi:hypothetical protein